MMVKFKGKTYQLLLLLFFLLDPATWAFIASVVLTTAGVVVDQKNQAATARNRRRRIADQDENQNPFRQKASEKLQNTAKEFDPNLRMDRREARDAENLKKYKEISDKNKGVREDGVFSDGNITEQARYDEAGGTDREERRLRDMENHANFFSPQQASNIDETHLINQMAGDLNTNRNFAQGQFNVDQQRIDSVRDNAGMAAAAGILKGLGTAAGFASAGMGAAAAETVAKEAAKEAAKKAATEAAVQSAIQTTMGTTASRFGLQTATAAGSNALSATAPALGAGAAGASSSMFAPSYSQAKQLASRQMFAPKEAAQMGVQDKSYQLWNLPQR